MTLPTRAQWSKKQVCLAGMWLYYACQTVASLLRRKLQISLVKCFAKYTNRIFLHSRKTFQHGSPWVIDRKFIFLNICTLPGLSKYTHFNLKFCKWHSRIKLKVHYFCAQQFFDICANPGHFLLILFLLHHNSNINWKKHWCNGWDSNPGLQDRSIKHWCPLTSIYLFEPVWRA